MQTLLTEFPEHASANPAQRSCHHHSLVGPKSQLSRQPKLLQMSYINFEQLQHSSIYLVLQSCRHQNWNCPKSRLIHRPVRRSFCSPCGFCLLSFGFLSAILHAVLSFLSLPLSIVLSVVLAVVVCAIFHFETTNLRNRNGTQAACVKIGKHWLPAAFAQPAPLALPCDSAWVQVSSRFLLIKCVPLLLSLNSLNPGLSTVFAASADVIRQRFYS